MNSDSSHLIFRWLACIDLICCDGCTKVYHAGCHKPKIHDLPEGEWFCMECQKSKREPKEKKKKYTGPLVADLGHKDIVCTVRFPRIECIVCEEHEGEALVVMPLRNWTYICDLTMSLLQSLAHTSLSIGSHAKRVMIPTI